MWATRPRRAVPKSRKGRQFIARDVRVCVRTRFRVMQWSKKCRDCSRGAAEFNSPARQRWGKWNNIAERQRRGTVLTQIRESRDRGVVSSTVSAVRLARATTPLADTSRAAVKRANCPMHNDALCPKRKASADDAIMPGVNKVVKAGVLYFVLVFAAGFALGTLRTLVVAPRLGARAAELMEAPVMVAVSFVAARWVVQRLAVPPIWTRRLALGTIALALMLLVEFTFVLRIRGLSLGEYFATRDPVSGAVYYAALALFAVMPMLVRRKTT